MRDIFKDGWIKFGCFLTGYDYNIMQNCSVLSKNYLKKITSALLIVMTIWGFIGYLFTTIYLQLPIYQSLISAILMVIFIVLIERQVILSQNLRWRTKWTRTILALIIAVIGAAVIDQAIFKNDIKNFSKDHINKTIGPRAEKLNQSDNAIIKGFDLEISDLRNQVIGLNQDIKKEGGRILNGVSTTQTNTHNKNDTTRSINVLPIYSDNPKIYELNEMILKISTITKEKNEALARHVSNITELENGKLDEDHGFLEELSTMFSLLFSSLIVTIAYIIWFLLFLIVESFLLISTIEKVENDYDRIVRYQNEIREIRLKILQDKANNYLGENLSVNQSRSLVDRFPS